MRSRPIPNLFQLLSLLCIYGSKQQRSRTLIHEFLKTSRKEFMWVTSWISCTVYHHVLCYLQGWVYSLSSCKPLAWSNLEYNRTGEQEPLSLIHIYQLRTFHFHTRWNITTLTAFWKAHLASVALAKGPMTMSKGYCAFWKTPSENTDHTKIW